MIKIDDIADRASELYREQYGEYPHASQSDARIVACTIAALVDEVNAELERVAGAILERVGARDLRPGEARAMVGGPACDGSGCGKPGCLPCWRKA